MTEAPRKLFKDYIEEADKEHSELDDFGILQLVETLSKGEWKATKDREGYVKRIRKRLAKQRENATPSFSIESDGMTSDEEDEDDEDEEFEAPEESEGEGIETPETPKLQLAEGFVMKQVGKMVQLPFRIVSRRTGWDGWLLTREEVSDLEESVTPVLNYYLPLALKEHGALIYMGYIIGTIALDKDMRYRDWKKTQVKAGDKA